MLPIFTDKAKSTSYAAATPPTAELLEIPFNERSSNSDSLVLAPVGPSFLTKENQAASFFSNQSSSIYPVF